MFCSQVLGIDAEFVSLAPAVKEPNPEVPGGPDIVVQAARLGLARVSVVRGGQTSGLGDSNDTASLVPVIDDYIRAVEPVHDYLTRFSGLVPGDLDPALSKHHIVELKHAYLKLRYLVDAGCVFVGHGLKQDFKMINVTVPPRKSSTPWSSSTSSGSGSCRCDSWRATCSRRTFSRGRTIPSRTRGRRCGCTTSTGDAGGR